MNNYAEDIQDDGSTLFLTVMNHNKKNLYLNYKGASILQDVYLWLKKGLDINYPDRPISNYSYMASMENVDEICDMIAAFGTGITDYKLVEIPVKNVLAHIPNEAQTQMLKRMERYYSAVQNMIDHKISEDNNIPENTGIIMRSNRDFFILQIKGQKLVCQTIQFEHNKNNILFELSEESDGTVRILDLLEILLSDEGKTYVVDELDRCLHPSLTYKFIETYLKLAAKKNLQLIVTTHESRLLDFDLLRRDEIWFIDKQNTGESDIYSLEEYNTRFDQKIDKAYLEGRYGGVPVFNTIYRT
jgi:AAA15 family ATPase/GTPase